MLYYTVIVKCPAGLERVTRSLHNLATLQLVCDGGGGNVLESYGATQKGAGEAAFCPLLREKCFLYTRLRMQKYRFAQHHNDTRTRRVSPFLLCKLLTFYAICWLSMQFSKSQIWKTPFKIWFLRSSTPLVSLPHLISPSKTSQDKHSESR